MKIKDAKEYIEDYRLENGSLNEQGIADLIVWAYDQGWVEGREDYREEQDPTDEQEWRKSR
jgi:hypothetical protein